MTQAVVADSGGPASLLLFSFAERQRKITGSCPWQERPSRKWFSIASLLVTSSDGLHLVVSCYILLLGPSSGSKLQGFSCLLACLLACLPACVRACVLACLLACLLPAQSLKGSSFSQAALVPQRPQATKASRSSTACAGLFLSGFEDSYLEREHPCD